MSKSKPRRGKRRKQSGRWIVVAGVTGVVLLLLCGAGTGIFFLVRNRAGRAGPGGKIEPPPVLGQPPAPTQPQVTLLPKTKARDPLKPSPALQQIIAEIDKADSRWRL